VNTGDRTGVRAALKIAPNENFSITPRLVYQTVEMDGWNRIDVFNILGNPFTSTRPKVTLGERQQFTQIGEPFTDDFLLGDVNLRYNFGAAALTSITSYTKTRRARGARRDRAHREHHGRHHRAAGARLHAERAARRQDGREGLDAGAAPGRQQGQAAVGGGRLLQQQQTRLRPEPARVRVESLTGIPTAGRFGAGRDVLSSPTCTTS
jgi:hypothetical protein